MNKKGMVNSALPIIIMFGIVIIIGFILLHFQNVKADRENPMCEDVKPSEGHRKYGCCLDCHRVDMSYMKHEFNSGFLSTTISNCYCVNEDKEVKQIW